MKILDVLQLSTRMFKTNRMRTILTIFGIGVGIGAILFLVSLGYGLQKVILDRIASSDALLSLDVLVGTSKEMKLDRKLVDELGQNEMVAEVSPLVEFNSLIDVGSFSGGSRVNFVKPSFFKLSGMELAHGDFFNDEELDRLVVSSAILKLFDMKIEEIQEKGRDIKVTIVFQKAVAVEGEEEVDGEVELKEIPVKFQIVGVIKDDVSPLMYLNIKNLRDLDITEYNQVKIKAKSKKEVEPLREMIFNKGYSVTSISETIDQANKIFTVIQLILGAFGIVSLIVSAIGMFNTMTISLLQRTKEIGIMKAIGAKNRDVKKMFLTEAVLIGFLGGASGIALGFALQYVFNILLNVLARTLGGTALDIFDTPSWFLIAIIVFSTVVGFLTGIWPAFRASKLNPLEALRYK